MLPMQVVPVPSLVRELDSTSSTKSHMPQLKYPTATTKIQFGQINNFKKLSVSSDVIFMFFFSPGCHPHMSDPGLPIQIKMEKGWRSIFVVIGWGLVIWLKMEVFFCVFPFWFPHFVADIRLLWIWVHHVIGELVPWSPLWLPSSSWVPLWGSAQQTIFLTSTHSCCFSPSTLLYSAITSPFTQSSNTCWRL